MKNQMRNGGGMPFPPSVCVPKTLSYSDLGDGDFRVRLLLAGWKLLFLRERRLDPDPLADVIQFVLFVLGTV
jgi:hypothetical protein